MHTPTSPVNFACAHAMKAANSSWRVWTNSTFSPHSWKAPMSPLIPSPG